MTVTTNNNKSTLNKPVFLSASAIILALLIVTIAAPDIATTLFSAAQSTIVDNGSWFYVLTVAIVLVAVVFLALSRYSEIKLGPDHAVPEYSYLSWLSMLFAAGMGIGLMFYGVAEPLMHYLSPPTAEEGSVEAVREAMKMTFFHWGLHAWAIYTIVALILAYFSYRHHLPLTMRSALYPLIGDKIYGWQGNLMDIFAVISTIFGVATSLGLGALQVNSGLNYLFDISISEPVQLGLIIGITLLGIVSVVTGLDKGIRRLSELNMLLAVGLLLFVLIVGPTVFLLAAMLQNTGAYLSDIVRNTFNLFAYQKTDWLGGWTIFYWGWWLAWAPFVGVFIARISRGRSIREFILGVLLVPTVFTLIWMTIFGNSAIDQVINQGNLQLGSLASDNTPVALFLFLQQFPWPTFMSCVAILMIVVFFVTSCDSGAMVVDMLCSHGKNDTPVWQRIYWAGGVGLVAAVLLLGGGLGALQTMTIVSALPFAMVLLLAMYGLFKSLKIDAYKRESLNVGIAPMASEDLSSGWKDRLRVIVDYPNKAAVETFIEKTVMSAFNNVAAEFKQNQIDASIDSDEKGFSITVQQGNAPQFIYAVKPSVHSQPDFAGEDHDGEPNEDPQTYYRAEVHLSEGGQNYDIMGYSKLAVINDIIDQYHKHQHFLHLLR